MSQAIVDVPKAANVSQRHSSAATIRGATDEPTWVKYLLITTTIGFLTLFLFVPLVAVFVEAFRKGVGAYFASFSIHRPLQRSSLR